MDRTESGAEGAAGRREHLREAPRRGVVRWMVVVTAVVGALAVMLSGGSPIGAALWSPSPDIVPTGIQGPLLTIVTVLESLAFGLGVAILALGWPSIKRRLSGSKGWAAAAFGSFAWLFLSPWIHDNLHIHYGHGLDAVIALNYLFHWGLVPFVGIILVAVLRSRSPA